MKFTPGLVDRLLLYSNFDTLEALSGNERDLESKS